MSVFVVLSASAVKKLSWQLHFNNIPQAEEKCQEYAST